MSNTFDSGRFRRYLVWDLRNAYNYFGLSLLILGACPLIAFVFSELFSLVFTGDTTTFAGFAKVMMFGLSMVLAFMLLPSKAYGRVTEKRYGSGWILIPASSLEKTLSMMLIMCMVMPLCLLFFLSFWDLFLSLVVRNIYGEPLITFVNSNVDLKEIPAGIVCNVCCLSVLNFWENVLIFTLGAICFKKSKVAKTFLMLFILSSIISSIFAVMMVHNPSAFFGWHIGPDNIGDIFPRYAVLLYSVLALIVVGLSFAIYCRVRTIKH